MAVAGCLQLPWVPHASTDPDADGVVSGRPVSDGKFLSFLVNNNKERRFEFETDGINIEWAGF